MPISLNNSPLRFSLGKVVITRNAQETIPSAEVQKALSRHSAGDWGDLSPCDLRANNQAVLGGSRILSSYAYGDIKFWIITEADRSYTTVLLPSDY